MTTPRVYIVQRPVYFDPEAGRYVPKYDLTPAEKWGALVHVVGSGRNHAPADMPKLIQKIRSTLAGYTARDYLLALGDPAAIAAAAMVAGQQTGGVVNLLRWDRLAQAYERVTVRV